MAGPGGGGESTLSRWLHLWTLLGLAGVHILLVAHFVPHTGPGYGNPVVNSGYAIEIYRVARARLAHELFKTLWTYDPLMLAGQRAGLVEPLGTRVFVFASLWLEKAVGSPVLSIRFVVLGLHFVFPFLGYAAARSLRMPSRVANVAFAGFSALWFFDSLTHGAWFSGRILWVVASGTMVLSLSLLHRFVTGGSSVIGVLAALAGVATTALHPVAGILGVGFGALLAFGAAGVLARRRLLAVLAAFAPALLFALAPLTVRGALSSEPDAPAYDTSLGRIFWDLLEVPSAGRHGPSATRTLFRTVALVAGAAGLVRYARAGDSRRIALTPVVVVCAAVGYAGAFWKETWPLDPYLLLIPSVLGASLVAAEVLADITWMSLLTSGPLSSRAVLAVCVALGIPRMVRTVGTFLPEILPRPVVRAPGEASRSALFGLFEPMPDSLRYEPMRPRATDLAAWLSAYAHEGRVLVDEPGLAAFLSVRNPLDVLGPIAERGSASRDADPRALFASGATMRGAEEFIRRYGVSWIVLAGPKGVLDEQSSLLEPPIDIFGYRVRRVSHPTTLVMEGDAKVTQLGLGSIQVADASGERITLRIHYDSLLVCRPGCRVERRSVEGDGQGFVSVPRPPTEFEVFVPHG